MKRHQRAVWVGVILWSMVTAAGGQVRLGLDTGLSPKQAQSMLDSLGPEAAPAGTSLRILTLQSALVTDSDGRWIVGDADRLEESIASLKRLRQRGYRIIGFVQLEGIVWRGGVREAGRFRLPVDLQEAAGFAAAMQASYRGFVDVWEISNEPDLDFVQDLAEHYTAYLKAIYLGIRQSSANDQKQNARSVEPFDATPGRQSDLPLARGARPSAANSPSVLMAGLGLPPGPWLERFVANDGFAYTDGFNYHYYGYAEDFTGVYRQHEAAVGELGAGSRELGVGSTKLITKTLPVILTEIGYGMLGKQARNTKEGRLRQWRWFKSVGEQAEQLQPEAALAFVLKPYLAYDAMEHGLTVPTVHRTEDGGQRTGANAFHAGGIEYVANDFAADGQGARGNGQVPSAKGQGTRLESWMGLIGKEIGGNQITPALAWWLAGPRIGGATQLAVDSRRWTVSTPVLSPVVIDFIAGEGLQPLKRFLGSFVTGNVPPGIKPEEAKPVLPPVIRPPKPPKPPRSEEFMIHVRTANGNLYEVYPTRMAMPDWQTYLEHQGNFTMSFYGRAELPWRFNDNKPVSLVVVMYPKELPATYEFKRVQLIKLGEVSHEEAQKGAKKPTVNRYGQGQVVLYNFSDKPVNGKLLLPEGMNIAANGADLKQSVESVQSVVKNAESIILAPGERREIAVDVQVAAERFERSKAAISFAPQDVKIPPARFVTELFPALEGLKTVVVAQLLQPRAGSLEPGAKSKNPDPETNNRTLIETQRRAAEEAPMKLTAEGSKLVAFAQHGARVEPTSDGFTVTVTETPQGKEQRVEVEIPWPDGLEFGPEEFLSLEFRLGSER